MGYRHHYKLETSADNVNWDLYWNGTNECPAEAQDNKGARCTWNSIDAASPVANVKYVRFTAYGYNQVGTDGWTSFFVLQEVVFNNITNQGLYYQNRYTVADAIKFQWADTQAEDKK